MEVELDSDLNWERFEVVGRGHLRDQLGRVGDIDLFAEESWAEIEVEAALEMLSNQLLVKRDLAESLNLLWHVVKDTVLIVSLLPSFLLFVVE